MVKLLANSSGRLGQASKLGNAEMGTRNRDDAMIPCANDNGVA